MGLTCLNPKLLKASALRNPNPYLTFLLKNTTLGRANSQNRMFKKLILIIPIIILCHSNAFAQNEPKCLGITNHEHIPGKQVISENGTSILLMDTCDYANRMYRYMISHNPYDRDSYLLLPSAIIDTTMLNKVEHYLNTLFLSSKKLKQDFYQVYKSGIKLLIGSIDDRSGEMYITIQFLTNEEYHSQKFYAYNIFLVVGQENLKYVKLCYHNDQFDLFSSYSHQIKKG